jgi:hypothetical protein
MLSYDILVTSLGVIIVMWYSDGYLIIQVKKLSPVCSLIRVPVILASYLLGK